MLKYTCKYWIILAPLVKKSLKKRYGKTFADNPMASNIYMSFVFFAVYKAANGKITIKALRMIAHEATEWKPQRLIGSFINANKPSGIRAIWKMMLKNAEWLEKQPKYKNVSWDFNFDESKHRDGYYYHFTQCPLNSFARCEGLLDVLPVMCDMDFLTQV